MPLALQAKLLRVLETGEVRPVGSDAPRTTDVRIIAATHRDLPAHVRAGQFREDLFFRLNVVPIAVPALRERREDIPILLEHFLTKSRRAVPKDTGDRIRVGRASRFSSTTRGRETFDSSRTSSIGA